MLDKLLPYSYTRLSFLYTCRFYDKKRNEMIHYVKNYDLNVNKNKTTRYSESFFVEKSRWSTGLKCTVADQTTQADPTVGNSDNSTAKMRKLKNENLFYQIHQREYFEKFNKNF